MNIRPTALVAVVLAAMSASLRADDWTTVRRDPANTAASTEVLRPPFNRAYAIAGATNEPLLAAGNTLFYTKKTAGGLRDLIAYDLKTRKPIWKVPNVTQPGAVSPTLGLAFTVIRTSAKPTSVSRLGANLWPCAVAGVNLKTGKTVWTYPIGDHPVYPAISPLAVQGSLLYLVNIPYCVPGDPCPGGEIVALDARKGTVVGRHCWEAVWRDQVGTVLGPPALIPDGKTIAVPIGYQSEPGKFAGQIWLLPTGAGLNDGPTTIIGDPDSTDWMDVAHSAGASWPMFTKFRLMTQGPDDATRAWALLAKPEMKWKAVTSTGKAHCAGPNGTILSYHSGKKRLFCANALDGQEKWSRPMTATTLAVSAGNLLFICGTEPHPVKGPKTGRMDITDGVLYVIDARNGKSLWSWRKADVTFNTPMVAAGHLFVSDSDGNIHVFQPSR